MNACPPSNHWTDHDRGCCHHPRKFPHAPTSQLPQREGNNCSDFCQQRLVLPVHLQVYSVPQQVKQGRMSTEGTSENVHSSFIVDLNLEKNPNIPSLVNGWTNCGPFITMEDGSAGKRNCLLWHSLGSQQGSPTQIGCPWDTIIVTLLGSKVAPMALGCELGATVILPHEAHLYTCPAPRALCSAQISDNPNVYLGTRYLV